MPTSRFHCKYSYNSHNASSGGIKIAAFSTKKKKEVGNLLYPQTLSEYK